METHPLCQPSTVTAVVATLVARTGVIRRALGDGNGGGSQRRGGGHRYDVFHVHSLFRVTVTHLGS